MFCSIGSQSGAVAFAKNIGEQIKTGKEPSRPRREPSKTPDARVGIPGFSSQAERSPKGKAFATVEDCMAHDPFQLLLKVPLDKLPHIYVDCGTEDRLLADNQAFAKLAMDHKIPIVYSESKGAHNGGYWSREVGLAMAVQGAILDRNLKAAITKQAVSG